MEKNHQQKISGWLVKKVKDYIPHNGRRTPNTRTNDQRYGKTQIPQKCAQREDEKRTAKNQLVDGPF